MCNKRLGEIEWKGRPATVVCMSDKTVIINQEKYIKRIATEHNENTKKQEGKR